MSATRSLVPVDDRAELDPNVRYDSRPELGPVERVPNRFVVALYRSRWLVLSLILLGLGAGWLLASSMAPTYRADSQIEFEQAARPGSAPTADAAMPPSDEFVKTQLNIIRSRSLAEKIVDSLHLSNNRAADSALATGPLKTTDAERLSKVQLVDRVRERVEVAAVPGSRSAMISFSCHEPKFCATVANAYVTSYIQTNLERQYDTTVGSRRFVEQRLAETKSKLGDSEKALIDYTRASGLIDPSAGTSSVSGDSAPHSLASDNLAQLNTAYSQARADRISAEQRWLAAQSMPAMSLPDVLNNPAVQQLAEKSAVAQAAVEEQRAHRLDTHPAVVAAVAQNAEINRQIQTLGASIKESIRDRYDVARRQEADLAGTVGRLKSQTLSDQGKGVRYNLLKRDADGARQLYDALLQRSNDLGTAAGLVASNVSVIDSAVPPSQPISPNETLWTAAGGLLGLLLGLTYMIVSWIRDDRVHSPESLDANFRLRVLGVLPRVKNPSIALMDPASMLSEAHYALRGSLETGSSRGPPKSIMFTSSREGEGKTTAAWGVAHDFALSGRRTLLIDGDMRKPSVQQYVDVSSPLGLSTVLAELSTAEAAIVRAPTPGLSVMLAGPMPPSPAALLSGKQLKAMLKHLSSQFDVIIIDAPPVFGLADAPRIGASTQSTIFVVEANRAKVPDVRGALRRLVEARVKLGGVVLTKFDLAKSHSSANLYVYSYGRRAPELLEGAV